MTRPTLGAPTPRRCAPENRAQTFLIFFRKARVDRSSRTLGEPIPQGMEASLTIRDLVPHTPSRMTPVHQSLNQIPDAKFRKSKPNGFELT